MDPSRFDHLTRLLSDASGRRAVLRALLGAVLGGTIAETAAKKKARPRQGKDQDHDATGTRTGTRTKTRTGTACRPQRRGKGKGKGKGKKKTQEEEQEEAGRRPTPPGCCGTDSCANPEPGSMRDGCDHAGRSSPAPTRAGPIRGHRRPRDAASSPPISAARTSLRPACRAPLPPRPAGWQHLRRGLPL